MKTPIKLEPVFKEIVWGGNRLKTDYGFKSDLNNIAEAWLLCAREDGDNNIANGPFKGQSFTEFVKANKAVLGTKGAKYEEFPLLIKFIDAKADLSVQVHPDDTYALENEGEFGKTEMWYVVDCKPGAKLAYGFKKNIDKAEFEKRIKDNTLDEVINYVHVSKGDVFFIDAGTLHAIGEGILIAEVQQNSNTTYRVSDYGRLGADGKPRELHIDKALDVTKCEKPQIPYGNIGKVISNGNNIIRELAVCDKFSAKLLNLNEPMDIYSSDSFISLIVLDGNAIIKWNDGEINANKGDSIFVPANFKAEIKGKAEILYSHI